MATLSKICAGFDSEREPAMLRGCKVVFLVIHKEEMTCTMNTEIILIKLTKMINLQAKYLKQLVK